MTTADETDLYVRVRDCVNLAAGPIYRRYRRWVHLDDLRQEVWLWVFAHRDTALELLARSDAYLTRRLRGVAERYARREKAVSSGYRAEDEEFYSIARIVDLLPDVLDPYAMPSQQQSSEISGKSETYGEWETNIADIRAAVDKLSMAARDELSDWVHGGMCEPQPEGIAGTLKSIQRLLGGPRPGGN